MRTYAILHGTPERIRFDSSLSDGITEVDFKNFNEDNPWNWEKDIPVYSSQVISDSRYKEWSDYKKKFVSNRWMNLFNLIEEELMTTGRFDVVMDEYFSTDQEILNNL